MGDEGGPWRDPARAPSTEADPIPSDEWVTVSYASDATDIDADRILERCRRGELPCREDDDAPELLVPLVAVRRIAEGSRREQ